jgi:uncharacterized protein YcbK (DUF882 family)
MTKPNGARTAATWLVPLALSAILLAPPVAASDASDWASQMLQAKEQNRGGSRRSNLGRADLSARDTRSLSGGISWQASAACVPSQLRGVLNDLAATYGSVTVTSTCRSRSANRAAGGAFKSYHLSGEAVDFRVSGGHGSVYAFLSRHGSVGGLKHYGGGLYHIDTGPRRAW